MTGSDDAIVWSPEQSDLASALSYYAEQQNSRALRLQAISAYEEALKALPSDQLPTQWAGTKVNFANFLYQAGVRESNTEYLTESATAARDALSVLSAEKTPEQAEGT
jgi:hypothetical protein